MLETIRIRAAGFPIRIPHKEFYHTYRLILSPKKVSVMDKASQDMLRLCRDILHRLAVDKEAYRIGATKVYLKLKEVLLVDAHDSHIDGKQRCSFKISRR